MIYMDTRCVNGCGKLFDDFSSMFYETYSRNNKHKINKKRHTNSGITEKTLASSALGQNFLKFAGFKGE